MQIDKDFEGGNIKVLSIDGDTVYLDNELRDTPDDWFYWAFRITGAQGRTMNFKFSDKDKLRVGYYGAAVSPDNNMWRWSSMGDESMTGFSYEFGPDEKVVYFCHDMRYGTLRFYSLCDRLGIPVKTLAVTEKNRNVPYIRYGAGKDVVLLTARHHACESTGNYVMEGIIEEMANDMPSDLSIIAVPFVDIDGVIDGDQGKNRRPHDHNRDYSGTSIYPSIDAIRKLADKEKFTYQFDLHSPWHYSGRHDLCFGVRVSEEANSRHDAFGRFFEEETRKDTASYQYRLENDLPVNVEWNIKSDTGEGRSCTSFFSALPDIKLAYTLETPYFGVSDNIVSQSRLIAMGRCMARAIKRDAANI